MTIVCPVMVAVRHIVTTISAQSSLSAGFFNNEVLAKAVSSANSGKSR